MPRSSPQTERLVDVIELLANSGTTGRTLAELARHLEVDKATCYPMLIELTRLGWLFRHPRRKTFHLGPGLVAIGRAAQSAIDVVDLAREPLARLAEQAGAVCIAVASSAEELVVAEVALPRAARGRRGGLHNVRVGDRIDLRPPLGSTLVAWSDPATIERWLSRAPATDSPDGQRRRYLEVLEVIRRRGFAVEQYPAGAEIFEGFSEIYGARRMTRIASDQASLTDDALLGSIVPDADYRPGSINTPVFDADGDVPLVLCILDLPGPVPGRHVTDLAEALTSIARDLTAQIQGRVG